MRAPVLLFLLIVLIAATNAIVSTPAVTCEVPPPTSDIKWNIAKIAPMGANFLLLQAPYNTSLAVPSVLVLLDPKHCKVLATLQVADACERGALLAKNDSLASLLCVSFVTGTSYIMSVVLNTTSMQLSAIYTSSWKEPFSLGDAVTDAQGRVFFALLYTPPQARWTVLMRRYDPSTGDITELAPYHRMYHAVFPFSVFA